MTINGTTLNLRHPNDKNLDKEERNQSYPPKGCASSLAGSGRGQTEAPSAPAPPTRASSSIPKWGPRAPVQDCGLSGAPWRHGVASYPRPLQRIGWSSCRGRFTGRFFSEINLIIFAKVLGCAVGWLIQIVTGGKFAHSTWYQTVIVEFCGSQAVLWVFNRILHVVVEKFMAGWLVCALFFYFFYFLESLDCLGSHRVVGWHLTPPHTRMVILLWRFSDPQSAFLIRIFVLLRNSNFE